MWSNNIINDNNNIFHEILWDFAHQMPKTASNIIFFISYDILHHINDIINEMPVTNWH